MLQSLESTTTCGGLGNVSQRTYSVTKLVPKSGPSYGKLQPAMGEKMTNRPGSWRAMDPGHVRTNKQESADRGLTGTLLANGSRASVETNGRHTMPRSSAQTWAPPGGGTRPRLSGLPLNTAGPTHQSVVDAEEPRTGSSDAHEWRVAKVQQVFLSGRDEPRKANLSRSASLSEKELKEAKTRSQEIAAHLTTPPGANSRGVLLFNRRRQRVNNLTSGSDRGGLPGAATGGKEGKPLQDGLPQHGREVSVNHQSQLKAVLEASPSPNQSRVQLMAELETPSSPNQSGVQLKAEPEASPSPNQSGVPILEHTMEEFETNPVPEECIGNRMVAQEQADQGDESHAQETTAHPSMEPPPAEVEEAPPGENLKDSLIPTPTNGADDPGSHEVKSAPAFLTDQPETPSKQYCEVQLTLSKPASVANRTARPFGNRSLANVNIAEVISPVIDLPPPPTYAETLSSPLPALHVRSPPSYSVLYPTGAEHRPPVVPQGPSVVDVRRPPMPKSGVLEDVMARRGSKKSMFTFIEKPKLAPNPDLLLMVQNADEKRKRKEHTETLPEEEHFALGAEASNFMNDSGLRGGSHPVPADIPPEWATCLKSPDVYHKPPSSSPQQALPHAGGKGAELFARRQSRMERYVVESPTHPDMLRSPSPTMSLPPSWKYATSAHMSPTNRAFNQPAKSLQISPKPAPVSQPAITNTESEQSKRELEISKRQPYQLQSSLFILSPVKDPLSSLPRAAPPPKPMLRDTSHYMRQTSCPTSPLPPSPNVRSTDPFRSIQVVPSTAGGLGTTAPNTRMSFGGPPAPTEVAPTSPVPFMQTRVSSPRTRAAIQSPRPTFSTKTAGIESQVWRPSYYYK